LENEQKKWDAAELGEAAMIAHPMEVAVLEAVSRILRSGHPEEIASLIGIIGVYDRVLADKDAA
jgi:hypothetical protein